MNLGEFVLMSEPYPSTASTQSAPVPVLASLRRPPRRKVEEAEMDITPMIDITFLLLIFFTVGTKIGAHSDVQLPFAEFGTNVIEKDSLVFTIRDEQGTISLYGSIGGGEKTVLDAGSPESQTESVRTFIEGAMQTPGTQPRVILMADRNVKHRVVAAVARAVAETADVSLYVAVLEDSPRS